MTIITITTSIERCCCYYYITLRVFAVVTALTGAVLIALDRMERSGTATEVGETSAVQNVEKEYGLPVVSIADLDSLMTYLSQTHNQQLQQYLPAVKAYRDRYGIN